MVFGIFSTITTDSRTCSSSPAESVCSFRSHTHFPAFSPWQPLPDLSLQIRLFWAWAYHRNSSAGCFVSFCVRLLPLGAVFPGSVPAVARVSTSPLLCWKTPFCLSVQHLMQIWVVSAFWLLWVILLWASVCRRDLVWMSVFSSFGFMPRSAITGSCDNSV